MTAMDAELTNFTAGELSPRLLGRVDQAKYHNGCQTLLNMVVMPQGGATKRPGTSIVAGYGDPTNPVVLIPFIFSTVQAYILEFGHLYIRFYTNDGQVQSGGVPVQIASPYTAADLAQIGYTQSADELFLTHPNYPIQLLSRLSGTAWTLAALNVRDGPYLSLAAPDGTTTLTPSGTSGTITLTASSAQVINNGLGFVATDVGRIIRLKPVAQWSWCEITAVNSNLIVTATVRENVNNGAIDPLDGTAATAFWGLGKWSATTGYPYRAMFWQNRLIMAGTNDQPNAIEGGVIGDFGNWAPTAVDGTVLAIHAFSWIISDDQVNAVKWLSPAGSAQTMQLGIGTAGSEKILQPATDSQALGSTNVQAYEETHYGSVDNVRPIRVAKSVLFADRGGRQVHEWTFNWQVNGYVGPDLAVLAEHITKTGITQSAWQQLPFGVIWFLRGDGQLIGLTYLRDQDVVAWHRHRLGGQYYGGPPIIESITCIPSADGTYDELWLAVKRTVNGVLLRSIEVMTAYFDGLPAEDATFVDASVHTALSGNSGTATVTGLTNAAGRDAEPSYSGVGIFEAIYDYTQQQVGDFTQGKVSLTSTSDLGMPGTTPTGVFSIWFCGDAGVSFGPDLQMFTVQAYNSGINGFTQFNIKVGLYHQFFFGSPQHIVNYSYITAPTQTTAAAPGPPHHLLISFNVPGHTLQVFLDDVQLTPTGSPSWNDSDGIQPNPGQTITLFGAWAAPLGPVYFGDLWFGATASFMDMTVVANRRLFITEDLRPVDLGTTGASPTGLQPAVFLHATASGSPSDFATNNGSGGAWTIAGGTLAFEPENYCTTPGPPAGSIVRINNGLGIVSEFVMNAGRTINVLRPMDTLAPAGPGTWTVATPFTEVTGMSYLAGEVVGGVADGFVLPETVQNGDTLVLPQAATRAIVGLPYTARLVPMPVDPAAHAGDGSVSGKAKAFDHLWLRLHETLGGAYGEVQRDEYTGVDTDATYALTQRQGGDVPGLATAPYSGVQKLPLSGGTVLDGRLLLLSAEPLPMTVLSLNSRLDVTDVTGQS